VQIFQLLISAIIGYLLGSINTSVVVSYFHGTDIRKHGSGNAGTTNTLRTLGKTAAIIVLIGDALKGIIACIAGYFIAGSFVQTIGIFSGENLYEKVIPGVLAAGLAAVIGHNWPLYFGFRGGKGVLTSAAVLIFTDWKIGLSALIVFIIIVAITKYVSLGSILGAIVFLVISIILYKDSYFTIFAIIISLLIIVRHHSNVKRLLNGTESKFGSKNK
jgi:glycerol-3-phosphate acyltransferase PlsY